MKPELWESLKPLVDQALDLPPEQLRPWLAALRANAPAVAEELELLLGADSKATNSVLDRRSVAAILEPEPAAGQIVGWYTLERRIGFGGMGTVWLGRRTDDPAQGRVAIKLLKLELIGRKEEERFAQEGALLASLTHPNIARFLDAGVSLSGQPYLVLEYLEGDPIDQFVERHDCSTERRIALFLDVLAAVSVAHSHHIIHRDIKPANVLVTADGTAKLLDFGIAKLMIDRDDGTSARRVTDPKSRALTPEFAAPEQIRGEAASPATDVYSLGVMLFLLLSGRHPTGQGCVTPVEYLRMTLTSTPSRLSAAMSAGGRPRSRGEAARINRLDRVLEKALEKEPGDRYPDVTTLAADLARAVGPAAPA